MTDPLRPGGPGQGWVVTAQVTDQVQTNQAGQVITGVLVYFTTSDGNDGVVFISDAHYNLRNVKTRVHEHAQLIDEVGRLTSDTHIR